MRQFDLYKEFQSKKFTDFKITSGDGQEYFVHRIVLSNSTEHHRKIFDNDDNVKEIKYSDVSGNTLHYLLKYIYTNEIDYNNLDRLITMYEVAKRWEMIEEMLVRLETYIIHEVYRLYGANLISTFDCIRLCETNEFLKLELKESICDNLKKAKNTIEKLDVYISKEDKERYKDYFE